MSNTISLISAISIDFVLSGEARVSLAHLVEFSHFVDLYVLEDKFYVTPSSIKVNYFKYFSNDSHYPLRPLRENSPLEDAVFEIDDETMWIYNAAPKNFTFSTESYEFWLNESSRREVPQKYPYAPGKPYDRAFLLYASQGLHSGIEKALEAVSQSKETLVPSTRNLLPFLSVFHEFDTPAMRLYRSLADIHRVNVQEVMTLLRPRSVYLPPLLTVLLKRCKTPSDLAPRLIELRSELQDFRNTVSAWLNRLDQASSMKDKFAISSELQSATVSLTTKYSSERNTGIYKELAGAIIDAAEEGNLTKVFTKPTFTLIKRGITDIAPELLNLQRFTGITRIIDEAFDSPDQRYLLSRVFGDRLDISQKEITELKKYQKFMETKYGVLPPLIG